ncbi:hypothetical protein BMON_0315 [Bifidobacterium mongoliense DSM 21395]|uniref:Uncharacterized protein n=2 Tax=Bifidobacterium mongoliense TaxID=518643 RepID=A0A087C768_9BIFI|nr:hypothetical protein BMON_0315 [Bifidobacterium mongoliense DSM 21395]
MGAPRRPFGRQENSTGRGFHMERNMMQRVVTMNTIVVVRRIIIASLLAR